jgi:hypothetical protein
MACSSIWCNTLWLKSNRYLMQWGNWSFDKVRNLQCIVTNDIYKTVHKCWDVNYLVWCHLRLIVSNVMHAFFDICSVFHCWTNINPKLNHWSLSILHSRLSAVCWTKSTKVQIGSGGTITRIIRRTICECKLIEHMSAGTKSFHMCYSS